MSLCSWLPGFVLALAGLDFVERHDDIVITGDSGTGKSHILEAIGLRASQQGISFRYVRSVDLLQDLHAGLADDSCLRRLKGWIRPQLLVIDDVGLGHVRKRDDEPTAAHTLFNLIDRRHVSASTAITSNIQLRECPRAGAASREAGRGGAAEGSGFPDGPLSVHEGVGGHLANLPACLGVT